jgi:integrative and conjugative element protein (TIGR02256 family)
MPDVFDRLKSIPGCAYLQKAAVDSIVLESATSDMGVETGGILLGRYDSDGYVVSVAGGPGPDAVHERDYFLRDLRHAKSLAAYAWNTDMSQWIGDWHTHPDGPLIPSPADLRSYRMHLKDPELGFTSFLSIVARTTGRGVALAAWAVMASHLERIELVVSADRE